MAAWLHLVNITLKDICAWPNWAEVQYIPRNMHTVFALLCFVVVIHWLIFPYPSGLFPWHCGNLTIAPVPAKQPWWIWINTSCEFIMNDCITTTKQSTTRPCAYFLGYTVIRYLGYNTVISSLSIDRQLNIRMTAWPKSGIHRHNWMESGIKPQCTQAIISLVNEKT